MTEQGEKTCTSQTKSADRSFDESANHYAFISVRIDTGDRIYRLRHVSRGKRFPPAGDIDYSIRKRH